jgi:hypothetical protein
MRSLTLFLVVLTSCSPSVPCGPETCRGCCAGSVCQRGTTREACGIEGRQCTACLDEQVCTTASGQCEAPVGIAGGAAGGVAGGAAGGVAGGAAGGMAGGAAGGAAGGTAGGAAGGAAGGPSTRFDALYPLTFSLNAGSGAVTASSTPRPAKSADILSGGIITSPFGTHLRRITDVSDSADTLTALRHEYSRRQAFNADSTRFIAQASNGWWYLYDADTLDVIPGGRTASPGRNALDGLGGDCEPQWHPTDPTLLWHTSPFGGLVWFERNVSTNTTRTLFDLTAPLASLGWTGAARTWFKGEGRPSNDGRWWALLVQTSNYAPLGVIMYDRQRHAIVGALPLQGNMPDHVSTSPLGNYAVVSWYGTAAASLAAEEARPVSMAGGVRAYTRTFSSFRALGVIGEHSDLALDAAGNEVFVMVTFHGLNDNATDGAVFVRRLDTGATFTTGVNAYSGTGTGIHISGTAFRRPGWAVVSKYAGVGTGPHDGQVLAVELQPPGRLFRLAHHRSSVLDYAAEPHATVNADFTRVVFASDWGGGTTRDAYEVLLPSWALP